MSLCGQMYTNCDLRLQGSTVLYIPSILCHHLSICSGRYLFIIDAVFCLEHLLFGYWNGYLVCWEWGCLFVYFFRGRGFNVYCVDDIVSAPFQSSQLIFTHWKTIMHKCRYCISALDQGIDSSQGKISINWQFINYFNQDYYNLAVKWHKNTIWQRESSSLQYL